MPRLSPQANPSGRFLTAVADLIVHLQRPDGEIPWHIDGKTDPWDHVESAMGLTMAGHLEGARKAFDWLREKQLPDGSWYSAYTSGTPTDKTRESNFSAYVAVGLYHYSLATGDMVFVAENWPVVERAITFALSLQAPSGEIYWALDPDGKKDPMALLTGCASIYFSLKCATALAGKLGRKMPDWETARQRLANAICHQPQCFNMTKSRFSMDWFYPVLCGVIRGKAALERINRFWKRFVIERHGVRCVSDQPWVTIAETCELVLTLVAVGQVEKAQILFNWISDKRFDDGVFWCGYTVPEMVIWPEEKIGWTNAACLLAADALYGLTPAAVLFDHRHWQNQHINQD